PPGAKSATARGIALGWPADWLVIRQRTTSPRETVARTSAGRTLELERSGNGHGTTTTSPLMKRALHHPPELCSSRRPRRCARAAANRRVLPRGRPAATSGRRENRRPPSGWPPARTGSRRLTLG